MTIENGKFSIGIISDVIGQYSLIYKIFYICFLSKLYLDMNFIYLCLLRIDFDKISIYNMRIFKNKTQNNKNKENSTYVQRTGLPNRKKQRRERCTC